MKSSKSMSSREIYTRLLLQKEHGYPLWIPESDGGLPEAYRGKGVRVGDVGILRNDGGFDYLFNACKPADDPINKGRVPEGFEPIIPADVREIETMHKRGSDIRSASVSRVEMSIGGAAEAPFLVGGGGGFEYSCSREKGAILVLPDGGARYDALNLSQFRSYAAQNAHAWYQFANIVHGREAINGSLYLVTGCDKVCSWGAASFFSPTDTRCFSLKFLVGGVAEGNIKLGYSWESTTSADVRAYPDGGSTYFVDSLRPNQCVFLRGFGVSIRTNALFQRVFGPTDISQISGTSKDRAPRLYFSTPYSQMRLEPTGATRISGWDTDSDEELLHEKPDRLHDIYEVPSQEPRPPEDWPDVDSPYDIIREEAEPHAKTASSFHVAFADVAHIEVDATTPDTGSKNRVVEYGFESKDNASKASSIDEGRHKEIDTYSAYNVSMQVPTSPLAVNEHDVPIGGTQLQQQRPATPSNQIPGQEEYGRPTGMPNVDVSFEASILGPSGGLKFRKRPKSLAYRVNTQDSSSIEPSAKKRKRLRQPVADLEQYQDANVDETIRGEEKKLKLELPESSASYSSTSSADHHHGNSSDWTKLPGDNATLSYRFPQAHDGQISPIVQLFDVNKQVEGVASLSDAGTRGPMEVQHSGLGTDDDTSSVRSLSSTQSSSGPADLTDIARSFQPQTELLNPCAKINEFILNTHPSANVAITHSDEWSSALSQGDDPDDLLRVLSDYKVIVNERVAILEAR